MNFFQRVPALLFKPLHTWPLLAQDQKSPSSAYLQHLGLLVLVPALASWVGLSLVGLHEWGLNLRIPMRTSVPGVLFGAGLLWAALWVLALIVNALAPLFKSTPNSLNALKLVACASTAGLIGGACLALPSPWMLPLSVAAMFYSFYLFYTGLPWLMKCSKRRAAAYSMVVALCSVVLVGATLVASVAAMQALGVEGGEDLAIQTPAGEVQVNRTEMENMASKISEAGERMDAAQKSGDAAAAVQATTQMISALEGASNLIGYPIDAKQLNGLLPFAIGAFRPVSFQARGGIVMGMPGSTAKADYVADKQKMQVVFTDLGGLGGTAAAASWARTPLERETNGQIEKVYKQGARMVREQYAQAGTGTVKLEMVLGNGVLLEAQSDDLKLDELKQLIESIDLNKAEKLQHTPK